MSIVVGTPLVRETDRLEAAGIWTIAEAARRHRGPPSDLEHFNQVCDALKPGQSISVPDLKEILEHFNKASGRHPNWYWQMSKRRKDIQYVTGHTTWAGPGKKRTYHPGYIAKLKEMT